VSTAADELLAECIAHPGDDAPRLVWADAIGGELGELVAIQCAARDPLSAAELASLNRRERELSRKSLELSGLGHLAHRVRFRRGFVDAADVETLFIVVASLATLVISIGGAGDYWGITRYMMLCPLPFLGAGVLARHHRGFLLLWLVLCVAIYWNFELCSYLTQGDPGACPCLGRGELHMPWAS
jgi:uncharacterized protein (TIGR02996 family)